VWRIYHIADGINIGIYGNPDTGETPPLTGWNTGAAGTAPAPTLSVPASDSVKPVFASATVPSSGLSVAVTLTEADSLPILPASVTGFAVTVDGLSRSISSATASGNIVTLTLASPPVFAGQTVTVAYTPGNVTDSAATPNAMLAFAAQSVTNSSTDTPAVRLNFTSPAGHEVMISRHRFLSGHVDGGVTLPAQSGSTYLDTDVLPGYIYRYAFAIQRISDGKTSFS
jgi:hypothetical protein